MPRKKTGPPCRRCKGSGVDPVPLPPRQEITVSPASCIHPPGRRIGDHCAVCGATVKGKREAR